MKKIIYDFGAGDGNNIPYYLLKCDLVIAVDANYLNCNIMKKKFFKEISEGKLIVENCIISNHNKENEEFFIHKKNNLLGQFPKPSDNLIENFYATRLKSLDVLSIFEKYGNPYYVKIDLEEYDNKILKRIFDNNINPIYISAEATNDEVITLFVNNQNYNSYKLIEGSTVGLLYRKINIYSQDQKIKFKFYENSAGPFGNDLLGNWIKKENFIQLMKYKKSGWRDIHASRIDNFEENINGDKYIEIEKNLIKKAKFIKRFLRLKAKLNLFKNG